MIAKLVQKVLKWKKEEKNNFILNMFSDLFLLFKSLIHWNLKKIVIYLGWILLWLALSFPFFLIYKILWEVSFLDIYRNLLAWISINTFDSFIINLVYLYKSLAYIIVLSLTLDFTNILFLVWGLFFIFSLFYSSFLLIKLSNWYLNWEKISFKWLDFFNLKKIIKFFNLTLLNLLILVIPAIIFLILTWILVLFSGNISDLNILVSWWSNNYFTILSFIFLIFSILLLIYLFFRIIFSYFILSEENEEWKSVFKYIKESFHLTKWYLKFFKLIALLSIVFILMLPLKYIWFLLISNWTSISVFNILFSLWTFVFIYGILIMIFTSFYKRELK